MIILLLCTDSVAVCEKPSNAHYNSNCVYFCPFKRSNNFDIMVFNSFIHTQTHTYAFRCFIVRSICSLLFPSTCLCHGLSPRCIFTISRQYQVYCTICVRQKQHYVNELALYCHCLNRSNRFKILLHWSIPSRCIIMCVRVVVRIIFCFDVFTIAPFWRVKCLATKTKLMKQKEKQCKKANNK